MKYYDYIVVGGGPSGIFFSLEIKNRFPDASVLLIEKGNEINKRTCPKRKTGVCVGCNPCNITTGFSGSGAFSDGKLTISDHGEIGGFLIDYIGKEKYHDLLEYTDGIYLKHGADKKLHGIDRLEDVKNIEKMAFENNLKLIYSPVRHLGTEKAKELYGELEKELINKGVEILFNHMVTDLIVEKEKNKISGVEVIKTSDYYKNNLNETEVYSSENVIIGVGREGSTWLKELCQKHNIETSPGTVDLGVRVETSNQVTDYIDKTMYEAKLINYTKTFDDKVRTFCWNPSGEVSEERYDNLAVANGHAYKDKHLKTNNTNFALLVSLNFTEPFNTPIQYGKHIAELANMLSGGKVLVQRYGDLKRGRRSTEKRISQNNLTPTLKDAIPGDLGMVLPYRVLTDICETIESLNHIMPGFNSDGTLLYGVEVKFYSNKIKVDSKFQTNINGLFVMGDGAGITRGLIQASMNGVYLAQNI